MIVKSKEELDILKEGGRRLSEILNMVAEKVVPGARASELNKIAEKAAKAEGDSLAFLGYRPEGASRPYPAGLCVSVNDEIVHGIPNEGEKILKEGDIVGLDMGLIHEGLITDSAITVPVGEIDGNAQKLLDVTKKALEIGISRARAGNNVGEVGFAIEEYVKKESFIPAEDLGGHGVGKKVHEEPYVPNIGPRNRAPKLVPGMVIAIEPIINEGGKRIYLDDDGYTFKTVDGKKSAQFEHTVVVTNNDPVILTQS